MDKEVATGHIEDEDSKTTQEKLSDVDALLIAARTDLRLGNIKESYQHSKRAVQILGNLYGEW